MFWDLVYMFFSPMRNDPEKHKHIFCASHPPSPGTILQFCLCLCVFCFPEFFDSCLAFLAWLKGVFVRGCFLNFYFFSGGHPRRATTLGGRFSICLEYKDHPRRLLGGKKRQKHPQVKTPFTSLDFWAPDWQAPKHTPKRKHTRKCMPAGNRQFPESALSGVLRFRVYFRAPIRPEQRAPENATHPGNADSGNCQLPAFFGCVAFSGALCSPLTGSR